MSRHSSQELWTEGEALERAGRMREALDRFVGAASAEDEAGRPVRARLLWEQIAQKAGATPSLLERLARSCARAGFREEAFAYWTAAGAAHHDAGRAEDASRARHHALELCSRPLELSSPPPLARAALATPSPFVAELLERARGGRPADVR